MDQSVILKGNFPSFDQEPFIARIAEKQDEKTSDQKKHVWLFRETEDRVTMKFPLPNVKAVVLSKELRYLGHGDIVRIVPRTGELRVLYRISSPHNSLFFTERCNSRCTMCSQPPQTEDDSYLTQDILTAIPLMDPVTQEIGISGGEPTLVMSRLVEILESLKQNLPNTAIHMLSNGRLFCFLKNAVNVANVGNKNLMIGIPVYSDIASKHDFVVQAKGAFDQTALGIMNLARVGVPIEIRFVVHSQTVDRLPQTARFIARNFPFVSHVAIMGLEPIGYAKDNIEILWTDPFHYKDKLTEAIEILDRAGLATSIYNHQLCTLPKGLWRFARQSISDWKNAYPLECDNCGVKRFCAGFFFSANLRKSSFISPQSVEDARYFEKVNQ